MPRKRAPRINNLVVISDLHAGCQLGLCPPEGMTLDEGGTYKPSRAQSIVWKYWKHFWDETVPEYTDGEPFAVVCNGDAIDGVHHGATHQVSHSFKDQVQLAYQILSPIVARCDGRYYHVRGTEAHVGKSAEHEETLAKRLGAIPNDAGQHARYDLRVNLGSGLVHLMHHIGTTGSQAYEATGLHKHLVECYTEAARWGRRPPDIVVRSHRHRYIETTMPTDRGKARAVVTPAWQLKTPFVWRVPGAAITEPHFGGIVIRWSDRSQCLFVKEKVWTVDPPAPVKL